ncbi:hypothetical protein ACTXT7_011701 [Hymenolepis weldensis]
MLAKSILWNLSQTPNKMRDRTMLVEDFIAPLAAPQGSFDLTATNDGPNIHPRVIVRIIPTPFVCDFPRVRKTMGDTAIFSSSSVTWEHTSTNKPGA